MLGAHPTSCAFLLPVKINVYNFHFPPAPPLPGCFYCDSISIEREVMGLIAQTKKGSSRSLALSAEGKEAWWSKRRGRPVRSAGGASTPPPASHTDLASTCGTTWRGSTTDHQGAAAVSSRKAYPKEVCGWGEGGQSER